MRKELLWKASKTWKEMKYIKKNNLKKGRKKTPNVKNSTSTLNKWNSSEPSHPWNNMKHLLGALCLPVSRDFKATWGQQSLSTSDSLLLSELCLLKDFGIINGSFLPPSGGICLSLCKITLLRFFIANSEDMKQSVVVTAFWHSCTCRFLPCGPLPKFFLGH